MSHEPPSSNPIWLEARRVCRFYRNASRSEVRAVADVSLTVPRGSFTALVGPSGSGKTTLLALLGALDRPTSGHVLLEGHDIGSYSDVALARVRRRFGFIFQDFALIPNLPVWENITCPLIPRGVAITQRRQIALTLLARLGLPEKFAVRPEELSGGEQQRVAAARALAGSPEAIFADEPTSNLDVESAENLMALLREFHAGGNTVVVSTHDLRLASLASTCHQLNAGRLMLPG